MKIGITGGTGFIARHVITHIFKTYQVDNAIVLLDNNPPETLRRHDYYYGEAAKLVYGDVRDFKTVFDFVGSVDAVIHLAAILGTPETLESYKKLMDTNSTNIDGSLNVFESCRILDRPCVYIQTGNHKNLSPYPISKNCASQYALMYNREFNTKITVIRGLVAYGEGQKHYPVKKVVPTFMVKALRNEPIPIYGDGSQTHDLIYAGDLAKVLVDPLWVDHNVYDRVIDGGSGHNYTVNEIADLIIKATGSKSKKKYLPMRAGEPVGDKVVADDSRHLIKKYNHKRLEEMIDQVAGWYEKVYMKHI